MLCVCFRSARQTPGLDCSTAGHPEDSGCSTQLLAGQGVLGRGLATVADGQGARYSGC